MTGRRTATVAIAWSIPNRLDLSLSARAFGSQYVDTENTRALDGAVVADLAASLRVAKHLALTFIGENIRNAEIVHDLTPAGLTYLGAPRRLNAGIRLEW